MSTVKTKIDSMLRGYIKAALWTSTDESDEGGGKPMDRNYSRSDVAASSVRSMRKDILKFVRANKSALAAYGEHLGNVWEHAGRDLWLTRNGHGTGFWDREYDGHDDIGKRLSAGARKLGVSDMYVGDDGKVYVSPER